MSIGQHNGAGGSLRNAHRLNHAGVRVIGLTRESGFSLQYRLFDAIGRSIRGRLRVAIANYRRTTAFEIGRREPKEERGAGNVTAFCFNHQIIDRAPRFCPCALPRNRYQKRQAAKRLGKGCAARHQIIQLLRGPCASICHIHMRIGAKPDQHVGGVNHFPGDVAVQIQCRRNWHIRPNGLAHPLQQSAFAVILMLCDHCAVQIKKDTVQRTRGKDA